jgi:hypothetical protein
MNALPSEDPIESRLRRDAQRVEAAAPGGMEQRIRQAIARSERVTAGERRAGWAWILTLTGGLGIAAGLLLVLRPDGLRSTRPVLGLGPDERAVSASLAQAVQAIPAQIWKDVQPAAQSALRQEPVQAEVTALYSDARSALGFLAYNFLPGAAGTAPATPPS